MRTRTIVLGALGALVPAVASAQSEPDLVTDFGIGVAVGGGVVGFTDPQTRDYAEEGGAWEARVIAGTRTFLAIEAGYVGTAQDIDALGLDTDATLIGTQVEANARLNLLRDSPWQPYVLAGAGYTRYDLTGADTNLSAVEDSDDLIHFPLGVGLGYRVNRMLIDVRATFRPTTQDDLLAADQGTRLDTWNATAKIGYEF